MRKIRTLGGGRWLFVAGATGTPGLAGSPLPMRCLLSLVLVMLLHVLAAPVLASPQANADQGLWEGLLMRDLDGREWRSQDLLGKVVVLDFWATWCAPCLEDLPAMRRLQEHVATNQEVVLIGVALDAMDARALQRWLVHHEVTWPQIHERRMTDGEVARSFGVEAVPRTLVVDPAGRLVAVDLRGEALRTVVRDLVSRAAEAHTPR